jgi:hypothetical protein
MTFWLAVIAGLLMWIAVELYHRRPAKPSAPDYGGWAVFWFTVVLCALAVFDR